MPLIGTEEWVIKRGVENIRQDLKDFLKYALQPDGSLRPLTKGRTSELTDWFTNRLEVICAFNRESDVLSWREREVIILRYGQQKTA